MFSAPFAAAFFSLSSAVKANKKAPEAHQPSTVSISTDDFQYAKKPLGEGAFGQVVLARMKRGTAVCAIKIVKKADLRSKSQGYSALLSEQQIMKTLAGNSHFVDLQASWHDVLNFYFMMPVYPLSLRDVMMETGALRPKDVKFYMAHLLHAVEFIHSQGIVHRDLKPENIFINENGHPVIGDFGLATTLALPQEGSAPKSNEALFLRHTMSCCGTPSYMAPEIYAKLWYGVSVDIWALGVIHYEMLTNTLPFNTGFTIAELARSIMADQLKFPAQIWKEEKGARAFSEMLLNKNMLTRAEAKDAQAHSYMSEFNFKMVKDQTYEAPFKPSKFEERTFFRSPWADCELEQCDPQGELSVFNFISPAVKEVLPAAKQPAPTKIASTVHVSIFDALITPRVHGSSRFDLSTITSSEDTKFSVTKKSHGAFGRCSISVVSIFHNKNSSSDSSNSDASVDFVMNRVAARVVQKSDKKASGFQKWIRVLVKKTSKRSA